MKDKPSVTENQVYVGKTIPGVVINGQVFSNGIPESLKKLQKEKPIIAALIVPVSQFAQARAEIRIKGSALHTLYNQI